MLSLLSTSPLFFLIWLVGLLVAITVHEFAHAFAADRLGDPTPRLQGRLTLNPLAHLDPIGTLMIVLFRFGWGKPVLFDPYNLDNPRRDAAIISLAGPVSNITLAVILGLLIRLALLTNPTLAILSSLFVPIIYLNVMLAIFNLIPIHPLDGGKILVGILPEDMAAEAQDILSRYGMIILILLIFPFFGQSPITSLILPAIQFVTNLILP